MHRSALRDTIRGLAAQLPAIGHAQNADILARHVDRHDLAAWITTAGKVGASIWDEIAGALDTLEHLRPHDSATRRLRRTFERANELLGFVLEDAERARLAGRLDANRAIVTSRRSAA